MAAAHLEELELPEAELRQVAGLVSHRTRFDLFGTGVEIGANAAAPVEGARAELGPFEVGVDPGLKADVSVYCRIERDPVPRATFVAGHRAWRGTGAEIAELAHLPLVQLAEARVRSALLAHAACVSLAGRGLVLAGPSRMGKSTLAAHLAVRGAGLLSDELAPLERSSGLVLPAPFPVGIRPGAAEALAEGRDALEYVVLGDRKKLVEIRALTGLAPAPPVRPAAVVFLTPRAEPSVVTFEKHAGEALLVLTGWSEGLGRDLAALPGLRVRETRERDGFFDVLLGIDGAGPGMPAVIRTIAAHGAALAGVRLEGLQGPRFEGEPVLVPITATAGVLEFARKIIPHQASELVRGEFDGRATGLVREIARLLHGCSFYKLAPGRLETMLGLLEALA